MQRKKLDELGRLLFGGDEMTIRAELDKHFQEAFQVNMQDASYEQGARVTGLLLAQVRAKTNA